MQIRKIIYTGPAEQRLNMTFTLNKNAPDSEVFPIEGGLVVRTSGNKAKGVTWGVIVHALGEVMAVSPELRRDLRALLDSIDSQLPASATDGVEPPDVVARIENLHAEIEEMRLTLAAERGDPAGAPSPGWEYGIIDEEGGLGWRKPTADGMLFAWGAGIDFLGADHAPDPHPGGWTRWLADEDGDLDEMLECVNDETWTARAAMIAADDAFAKIERLAQTSQYPSPAQAVRPG